MQKNPTIFLKKCVIQIILTLIKGYRLLISPWFRGSCRFNPSCSRYTEDVIMTHGIVKGIYLSMMRILRCHPWGGYGDDPVPPKKPKDKHRL